MSSGAPTPLVSWAGAVHAGVGGYVYPVALVDVSELYRTEGDDAVVLAVHVQPGAGRSAVAGRHGAALRVRVAAAPEGGRANEACAALLAETFGLAPSAVELAGGATSRTKQFRLAGVDLEEFPKQLERVVAGEASPGGQGRPGGRR